jgi:hypothetical protein
MRARQRHINPARAGARIALDARFVTGLNDGDAVSTWSNRTGSSDFTGSGTARPAFTASSFSGRPAITFDGTNDTMTATGITWDADFVLVFVLRLNRSPNYATGQIDAVACKTNYVPTSPRKGFLTQLTNAYITTTQTYARTEYYSGTTESSPCVINGVSQTAAAGNVTVGTALILSASGTGSNTDTETSFTLGREPFLNVYGQFNFGSMVYLPVSSTPLRRRFEQSAAYSFKIACS